MSPRRACLAAGLLGWVPALGATPDTSGAAAAPDSGRRWRVGRPDGELGRIADAARQARDGDTVEILAGDYRADVAVWPQRRLRIRAVGGPVRLFADGVSAEGKAIWVIRDGEFNIEGIEFHECRVRDRNGAGIRVERGQVRVVRCRFFGNENGVLTGNHPLSRLLVDRCEFGDNGHGDGYSHNLYVGRIGELEVRGSSFANAQSGHLLKSRARESLVTYNRLADDPNGRSSYELEFPDGGRALVLGNVLVQSPSTENRTLLSFGAEGAAWPDDALVVAHNTFVNLSPSAVFVAVKRSGFPVHVLNNVFAGSGGLFGVDRRVHEDGNRFVGRPDPWSGRDDQVRALAATGRPGFVAVPRRIEGWEVSPQWEYRHPRQLIELVPGTLRQPGALQ